MAGEAFRMLRANIDFVARSNGLKSQVLMVTSFNEGAGKSFTTRHLAGVLASTGKRVVVIDTDIRKGTLSHRLGFSRKTTGLTDYLSDYQLTVADILTSTPGGISVITSGPVPPNPVELLMNARLDSLVHELRSQFDYIVMDGVPFGIVADASIVSRVADLTVFVIRAGRFDRRMLPEIQALYDERKLGEMGVVLNAVAHKSHGYGYGYGYG